MTGNPDGGAPDGTTGGGATPDAASIDGAIADSAAMDGARADAPFEAGDAAKLDATGAAETSTLVDATSDGPSDASVDHGVDGPAGCSGVTPIACGATCTNTLTDALNCGACNIACPGHALGETCAGGVCQAYPLVAAPAPFALTTDGANVYYLQRDPVSGVELASVPVGGGTVSGPNVVAGAASLATDGVDVYWGGQETADSAGYLSLAPVGDLANATPIFIHFTDPEVFLFADTASSQLYFATLCDGIFAVPFQTPNVFPDGNGAGGNGCVQNAMAADATRLYWANPSSNSNSLLGIFSSVQPEGTATTLSNATNVQGLAVQGAYLYYTDAAGGTVSRVPTNGSAVANALAVASSPRGLVADASNIYWIDALGATIMKVALGGGTATPVATGQSAVAIAADATSVYWANATSIMRLPK